jgi:hypothetical protein
MFGGSMAVWISFTNATAVATKTTADSWSWASPTVPEVLQIGIAVIALIIGGAAVHVLVSFRDRFPKPEAHPDKDFARMICDEVWAHTRFMRDTFAQRLRQPAQDIAALRIQVRILREDLAAPVHFVNQMQLQPPANWPKYGLFAAFTAWGGQLKALESQLADLQHALNYPVVKEPVDKARDAGLVQHFEGERVIFTRAIDQLQNRAIAVCEAACKTLDHKKAAKPGEHGENEAHPECPCCRHHGPHPALLQISPEIKITVAPAPTPTPTPIPTPAPMPAPAPHGHAMICHCVMPSMCHCMRACTCSCSCGPAKPVPQVAGS